MTALPAAADFTGSAITKGEFKTAMTDLRAFLAALIGSDGTLATALDTLSTLLAAGVTAKSAAYTVVAADRGTLFNCTGTWTLTLLAAATAGDGFAFGVTNTGTGTITLDGDSAETIDGATTYALAPGTSVILVCTGTAWLTVGKAMATPVSIANGGTGAETAAAALTALGGVSTDHGHDAVGSVSIVQKLTSSSDLTAGSTYSGSNLAAAAIGIFDAEVDEVRGSILTSSSLSGTWRMLSTGKSGANLYPIALAQRIA